MNTKKTQKQETFCLKYFEIGNATEAALLAGYSPKTARFIAAENLSKPIVRERIEELRKAAQASSVADVMERKGILSEIARGRLTDYTACGPDRDLISVGPESPNTAALSEVTSRTEIGEEGANPAVITKLKLHNPIQAISELNKMEGEYPPSRMEVSGKDGAPIEVDVNAKELSDEELITIIRKGSSKRAAEKKPRPK